MTENTYVTPEQAAEYFDDIDNQKVSPQILFSLCMMELLFEMLDEARDLKNQ